MRINGYPKGYPMNNTHTMHRTRRARLSEESSESGQTANLGKRLTSDQGTAARTTVYVSRDAFDQILRATTHQNRESDWQELGDDGRKKWVVIHGQRFECPISQSEKDKRKKVEDDYKKLLKEKGKDYKPDWSKDPRGNVGALRENGKVVHLMHRVFNTGSFDDLLTAMAKTRSYSGRA